MSKKCDYCGHSQSYHRKDKCIFQMTPEDICDCFCFTEIKDLYKEQEDDD